jgi:hypothetical protein
MSIRRLGAKDTNLLSDRGGLTNEDAEFADLSGVNIPWVRPKLWPVGGANTFLQTERDTWVTGIVGIPYEAADVSANSIVSIAVSYTASGNVFFDPGDGNAPINYRSSNTIHYVYSTDLDTGTISTSFSNSEVTFTATGNLVSRTAHPFSNGDVITLYNFSGNTSVVGVNGNDSYYVINTNANDFQISNTAGGAEHNILDDATVTLDPYRYFAKAQIYPTSNAVTIDTLILTATGVYPNSGSTANNHINYFIEHDVNLPDVSQTPSAIFDLSGDMTINDDADNLQKITIRALGAPGDSVMQNYTSLLSNRFVLKDIQMLQDTSQVTNMSNAFYRCYNLENINTFDTSSVGSMSQIFYDNYELRNIPNFDYSSVTSLNAAFRNNYSLSYVGNINAPLCTNWQNTFYNCSGLRAIAGLNTSAATTFASIFFNCGALTEAPLLDTRNCTTFSGTFSQCYSLKRVQPIFDCSSFTGSMSQMFHRCRSLVKAPKFINLTVMDSNGIQSMHYENSALKVAPEFVDIPAGTLTNFSSTFYSCLSLVEIPEYDYSGVTSFASAFLGCAILQKIGTSQSIDAPLCTSTNQMFSQCTGIKELRRLNFGSLTTCQSMFYLCYGLRTVPHFSTTGTATLASMFGFCKQLESVPLFDTSSATSVNDMFGRCGNIKVIPALDLSAVTLSAGSATAGFAYRCYSLNRCEATGMTQNISFERCNLSANAINNIFTNLGTSTSDVIYIGGNPGTTDCDTSIATGKSWIAPVITV